MRKIIIITIMAMLFTSSLTITSAVQESRMCFTSSNTIYVDDDGGQNFTKIQDAIDNASDGDTIFVYCGNYNESIVVNKSITLQGENKENTTIQSPIAISVYADNVTILGFKLISNKWVIKIEGNSTKIKNNIIIGKIRSINLIKSSNDEISYNFVEGYISLYKSNNNTISKNEINGLRLESSSFNKIEQNINNGSEINVNMGSSNIISYNVIKNCNYGLIVHTNGNVITYNDFISNDKDSVVRYLGFSRWYHNYWGRPRVLPKILVGFGYIGGRDTRHLKIFYDFDMRPALKPNCDFETDN